VEDLYSLNSGNTVTRPAGELQGEQLSVNQQQISTDVTGFEAGNSTLASLDPSEGIDPSWSVSADCFVPSWRGRACRVSLRARRFSCAGGVFLLVGPGRWVRSAGVSG
jgi:hypothetical protein